MSAKVTPTLDNSLEVGRDVVVREVAGELVLLDLGRAEYFGLNPTGTRIWQGLSRGLSLRAGMTDKGLLSR
jgi:hypothetical protein